VGYFSHNPLSFLQYPHPASPLSGGGAEQQTPETARFKCLKTAVKNGAEQEVQDLRLESRSEGTA